MRFRRVFRTAVPLTAVLLLLLSCCAEEEKKRGYSVPETLCGLGIGGDLVDPFLPPGERTYQSEEGIGTIIWSCDVSVDGEDVFQVTRERWEPGWSTRRFATVHAYVKPEHEAADESYVYSARGAVATVRCTEKGGDRDLFLVARVRGAGMSDAEAMKKLITTYRREYLETDPCAED